MLYLLSKMASDTPPLPSAAVVLAGHMGLTVGTVGAEESAPPLPTPIVHWYAQWVDTLPRYSDAILVEEDPQIMARAGKARNIRGMQHETQVMRGGKVLKGVIGVS